MLFSNMVCLTVTSPEGYNFGWIEGEMHEKSPFNLSDFVQQRKRWLQVWAFGKGWPWNP
jgi:ribosome modulation factor